MNQLGKADGQPNILTFHDCQGNPVKDLQVPIDPQTQTEIPGVQSDVPPTTKMMEESTPEEPPSRWIIMKIWQNLSLT